MPPDRPLRLGLPEDALPGFCRPVEETFHAALYRLRDCKAIEVIALPALGLGEMEGDLGLPVVATEAKEIWRDFSANTLGCDLADFVRRLGDPEVQHAFGALLADDADLARRYSAFRDQGRADLQARIRNLYERYSIDAMVMPTAVVQPPKWEEAETLQVGGERRSTFLTVVHNTTLATLIGAPSLSLVAGFDRDRLPVGLMLDGPVGSDLALLEWGSMLERHLGQVLPEAA